MKQAHTLAKLVSFTIIWNEGKKSFEGKVFTTWEAATKALKSIYEPGTLGYNKVKVCIKWDNGAELTDRIDLGDNGGDLNPHTRSIKEYMINCTSSMYESNLQKGDRLNLQWEDEVAAQPFTIVDYSEKAIVVIGDTKPIKEQLKAIGGKWNKFLTCGPGWVFSKKKTDLVKSLLSI